MAWTRAILLGLLSWFIPFLIGFALFPVKKANAPLFATLMYLAVLATGGVLLAIYFRKRPMKTREAVVVGALWLVINLMCDYPMFAFGPMKMTALAYYSEIGLVYLTFPAVAFLSGQFSRR